MQTASDGQRKALRRLERALKACADAGLLIIGMDDELLAMDAERYHAAEIGPQEERCNRYRRSGLMDISDHGAYLDSGGW